jgi:hypothetical protein
VVKRALAAHPPGVGRLPTSTDVTSTVPIDPAWGAAKASGQLSLLTQEEVQVYSEADRIFAGAQKAHDGGIAASMKRGQFEFRYMDPDNEHSLDLFSATLDLTAATAADLNEYLDLLIDEADAWSEYRVQCQLLRGAETAVLGGERDLGRVQKAELKFYSRTLR